MGEEKAREAAPEVRLDVRSLVGLAAEGWGDWSVVWTGDHVGMDRRRAVLGNRGVAACRGRSGQQNVLESAGFSWEAERRTTSWQKGGKERVVWEWYNGGR